MKGCFLGSGWSKLREALPSLHLPRPADEEAHMVHGDSGVAARRDDGRSLSRIVRNSARESGSCTNAASAQESWLGVAW